MAGRLGRCLSSHQDTVVPLSFAKALLTNLLEDEREGIAALGTQPLPWNGALFMLFSLIFS